MGGALGWGEGGGGSQDHTVVRDKLFVCQLPYSYFFSL